MTVIEPPWAAAAALLAGLAILLWLAFRVGLAVAHRLRARAMRRAAARGAKGERRAEALLARAGYRLLQRQVAATLEVLVDGQPVTVRVVADAEVSRGRRRFIAETKSGRDNASITNRATRRQLLEYHRAFPGHGLLLVDIPAGRVREVAFA